MSREPATPAIDSTGIAWLDATRVWLARFPLSIIQLAGRIGVGATFFKAGLLKYQSWEFTVRLFQEEYRVPLLDPAVAARIAMVQELTIPILLFLGLATRIATLPLLGMIAVIQTFVYPNAYNEHLVWGAILVLLLTRGPGVFSVDYLIESIRRPETSPSHARSDRRTARSGLGTRMPRYRRCGASTGGRRGLPYQLAATAIADRARPIGHRCDAMMRAGVVSSGGVMAAMGSLIGHLLYGSLLGIIASAPEPRVAHA